MSSSSAADHLDVWSGVRSDVPRTILAALDGSPFAESALAHACPLARALGSSLHLVTVLDPRRSGATSSTSVECRLQWIETVASLERIAKTLRLGGHDCTFEVREGQPSAELVACVLERGIDLVAVAARPRREDERFVPGGVAPGVIASGIPSLLIARGGVRRRGRRPDPVQARYRRIGVAVDGSRASHRVLGLASLVARREGAEIVLVHVLESRSPHSSAGASAASDHGIVFREASEAMRYLKVLEQAVSRAGSTVRSRVFCSWSAADALAADADLLVLAGAGDAGEARGFGSSARRLMLHSRIPVLVLRNELGAMEAVEPWTLARVARARRSGSTRRRSVPRAHRDAP